jgi:hypothetical protein
MTGQVILEFKKRIQGVIPAGDFIVWESDRLNCLYPMPDMPKGNDRGVCHSVNGFIEATHFTNKTLANSSRAGLYGEYAGLPAVIQTTNITLPAASLTGVCSFPCYSTFANLAPNIFMRFAVIGDSQDTLDYDILITGSLICYNARF